MFLKLNGKEYELKFTYRTIRYLEDYYGMGIGSIFEKLDMNSVRALTVYAWAMLKHNDEWKNKTVEDVEDTLDKEIEEEALSITEIGDILGDVINNSTIVKSMGNAQTGKKGNGKKPKK